MKEHKLWCGAYTDADHPDPMGPCICSKPQPPDTRTKPMFAELECPHCGGVDHPPERCPKRSAAKRQMTMF